MSNWPRVTAACQVRSGYFILVFFQFYYIYFNRFELEKAEDRAKQLGMILRLGACWLISRNEREDGVRAKLGVKKWRVLF